LAKKRAPSAIVTGSDQRSPLQREKRNRCPFTLELALAPAVEEISTGSSQVSRSPFSVESQRGARAPGMEGGSIDRNALGGACAVGGGGSFGEMGTAAPRRTGASASPRAAVWKSCLEVTNRRI
jgi:hypothetical protein